MNEATTLRVRQLLERTGALRTGHFELSSGRHSGHYCQCAALFEHPRIAEEVAWLMKRELGGLAVDTVLAPALGGVVWGHELARALDAHSLFAERSGTDGFALRRGFSLEPGERVLLAEDVITTGGSVAEVAKLVVAAGATVVGYAAVAQRGKGRFTPPEPVFSLITLDFPDYAPDDCPLCKQGVPVAKPGSRPKKAP